MYHVPGIEGLHALRDSLGVIVQGEASDWTRRPEPAEPFPVLHRDRAQCAQSRACTTPTPACVRSWSSHRTQIGVYLDWRTQEVGVAAALSGDQALIEAYRGG